jgi:hypothetical protein
MLHPLSTLSKWSAIGEQLARSLKTPAYPITYDLTE